VTSRPPDRLEPIAHIVEHFFKCDEPAIVGGIKMESTADLIIETAALIEGERRHLPGIGTASSVVVTKQN
jgi:hypothetical protein